MSLATHLRRLAFLAPVAALALSACGPIVNVGGQPPNDIFRLRPIADSVVQTPAPGWRILVDQPTASGGLDSNRIAVFTGPLELKFLADARWAQRLPDMLQSMLIDSLENGADAMAISYATTAAEAPYVLASDIRDFQADVTDSKAPMVTVRIAFTLSSRAPSRVVGYKVLQASADASADNGPALADAFNRAMQEILRDVVTWTAAQASAAP